MIFASLTFLIYFLPTYLLFYFGTKTTKQRNWVLIFFSLIFYAWGEPLYVFLLIIYTFLDFQFAKKIESTQKEKIKKIWLIISICLSLSLLCYFKYLILIIGVISDASGLRLNLKVPDLPLGISFYIFQSISYVLDVYYEKSASQKKYFNYLLYISLFHQLVAGPIVRYPEISEQINKRSSTYDSIILGFYRFSKGLFKKVVFANVAAQIVTVCIPESNINWTSVGLIIGVMLFAIQIYYDFSGYSDMAIGLGQMIGFKYLENFNYPFVSKSIKEFWTRWHISLGSFIRDYFYTPVNYNLRRFKRVGPYLIVVLSFFISGLWHGASYNFILWGLYFGLLIVIEDLFLIKLLGKVGDLVKHIYTLFFLFFSFALFYFTDLYDLKQFFKCISDRENYRLESDLFNEIIENKTILIAALVFLFPLQKLKRRLINNYNLIPIKIIHFKFLLTIFMLSISILFLVSYSFNPFIYFRF